MDNQKEYLNEQNFQYINYKIRYVSLVLVCLGLLIGGCLFYLGYNKQKEIKEFYSVERYRELIEDVQTKIELEEEKLTQTKKELEEKVKPDQDEIKRLKRVKFTGFDKAYYERQDKIEELSKKIAPDLKTISEIEMYFENKWCVSTTVTKDACKYVNEKRTLESTDLKHKIEWEKDKYIPFYIGGGFVMFVCFMAALATFLTTKRRELLAYNMQSVMPLVGEGVEKMMPTAKKVTKEMAPIYGEVAKEIAKGIKEGLDDKK